MPRVGLWRFSGPPETRIAVRREGTVSYYVCMAREKGRMVSSPLWAGSSLDRFPACPSCLNDISAVCIRTYRLPRDLWEPPCDFASPICYLLYRPVSFYRRRCDPSNVGGTPWLYYAFGRFLGDTRKDIDNIRVLFYFTDTIQIPFRYTPILLTLDKRSPASFECGSELIIFLTNLSASSGDGNAFSSSTYALISVVAHPHIQSFIRCRLSRDFSSSSPDLDFLGLRLL